MKMKDSLLLLRTPSILAVGAMMKEDVPGLLFLPPFYRFSPSIKQSE